MHLRFVAATAGLTSAAFALAAVGPATAQTGSPKQAIVNGEAQPVYAATAAGWTIREAWVTAPVDSDHDGVNDRVHIRYAKANDAPARVPIVMHASPYFTGVNDVPNHNVDVPLYDPTNPQRRGADVGTRTSAKASAGNVQLFDPWTAQLWIPRGFGWVEVESLGTGGSTGCPTTGGVNETIGPKAVIDWLGGRGSAVDATGAPVTASWSDGKVGMIGTSYDGTLPNAVATTGVAGLKAIIPVSAISDWYGYYRAGGAVVAPGGYQGEDTDVLAKFVLTRKNPEVCNAVIAGLAADQDRLTGDSSPFWQVRSYLADVAKVKAAVYVAHGLDDWNVKPSQAGLWYQALKKQGVETKIYWHPGGHGGEPPLYEQNRWFTHYLMGVDNGAQKGPRAIIVNPDGKNVRYADWPVPSATDRTTPLADLTLRAGTAAPKHTFSDRPDQDLLGFTASPNSANGLAYSTAPLSTGTRLSGFVKASMRISLGQGAANLSIGVLDLPPSGPPVLVTQGWADPQNRNSRTRTDPITPGQPMTVGVNLEATDHYFGKGHRIAVTILQTDHEFTLRPPAGNTMTVDTAASTVTLPLTAPLP